ncbi:ParA family protein [Neolewinella litorea]|uniref:ParA family protein n=1 Tax=Neolewinella litorea TaxID=2562452 RepID=A0A4S4N605_9BACT|nr:ParA family protein [Neolewinella litorea]THH34529.1 ParA family protein [Neolewinella litorea]
MSITIAVANFKGGVGKTTSTINLGAALQEAGKKVLLVDLDAQYNLTQSLGLEGDSSQLYNALSQGTALEPVEVSEGLYLIPSSLELIKADIELSSRFKREEILSTLLRPLTSSYDYILLDCPPSLGVLTLSAFVAAHFLIVPIEAEFLALKGYTVLSEALSSIGLQIDRVFVTKYDGRKVLNRNVLQSIKENLGERAFSTVIRENVSIAEAPATGLPVTSYQPTSYGAADYRNLAAELLQFTTSETQAKQYSHE